MLPWAHSCPLLHPLPLAFKADHVPLKSTNALAALRPTQVPRRMYQHWLPSLCCPCSRMTLTMEVFPDTCSLWNPSRIPDFWVQGSVGILNSRNSRTRDKWQVRETSKRVRGRSSRSLRGEGQRRGQVRQGGYNPVILILMYKLWIQVVIN